MRLKPSASGSKAQRAAAISATSEPNNSEATRKISTAVRAPKIAPGKRRDTSTGRLSSGRLVTSDVWFQCSDAITVTVSSAFITNGCSPLAPVSPCAR